MVKEVFTLVTCGQFFDVSVKMFFKLNEGIFCVSPRENDHASVNVKNPHSVVAVVAALLDLRRYATLGMQRSLAEQLT